jgi:two-component system, OmpR family, phosphate regulon sensor histidine kinase PhoR
MTSFLQISVADNGIGIPAEYQSKIFDKFFRVPHGNKHNIKGYGLGLSYVSHIVKKHHGDIDVHSHIDKGSTFIVNLPTK